MDVSRHWRPLLAGALLLALFASACQSSPDGTEDTSAAAANVACEFELDELVNGDVGVLTVATSVPAVEPWYHDGNPTNGEGYESALAYEIAEVLGVAPDLVAWLPRADDELREWKPETFDFAIAQLTQDEATAEGVTVSEPYYQVNHALVTPSGQAAPESLADVRELRLSTLRGMADYDAILDYLDPATEPVAHGELTEALAPVADGTADAAVLDLPTAFRVANDRSGWDVVAQFPPAGLGMSLRIVVEHSGGMQPCVNDALEELDANGTIDRLQRTWLVDAAEVPMLSE